jgi:hypothetical protein
MDGFAVAMDEIIAARHRRRFKSMPTRDNRLITQNAIVTFGSDQRARRRSSGAVEHGACDGADHRRCQDPAISTRSSSPTPADDGGAFATLSRQRPAPLQATYADQGWARRPIC